MIIPCAGKFHKHSTIAIDNNKISEADLLNCMYRKENNFLNKKANAYQMDNQMTRFCS